MPADAPSAGETLTPSDVFMDWAVRVNGLDQASRFTRVTHARAIRAHVGQHAWRPDPDYCRYVWGTATVPPETTEVLPDA